MKHIIKTIKQVDKHFFIMTESQHEILVGDRTYAWVHKKFKVGDEFPTEGMRRVPQEIVKKDGTPGTVYHWKAE